MKEEKYYNVYSRYLKTKYGERVYKLPISLPGTCPNRDGFIDRGGCIFCGEEGGSFENLSNELAIKEQLETNMSYIRKRYKAEKFIAYFQNFTNTYYPLKEFKSYIDQAIMKDIVEISISTRPDSINKSYLDYLKEISDTHNINISIELGLQTVNYHTLEKINRGHSLAEFIDSVMMIKSYGFEICAHIILNFPWDDTLDVIESAKILSALKVEQVKLHSLYIVEETKLGDMYKNNEFEMISMEQYIERVILFLEYLHPDIVIQRLMGRAPSEKTLFVNWNTSWWKIKDTITDTMERENRVQGDKCDYLGGKALKKFT